jgi:hypothetical protein
MNRRDFLRCLGGAAVTWPLGASAEQTTSRTIGWFSFRSAGTRRLMSATRYAVMMLRSAKTLDHYDYLDRDIVYPNLSITRAYLPSYVRFRQTGH